MTELLDVVLWVVFLAFGAAATWFLKPSKLPKDVFFAYDPNRNRATYAALKPKAGTHSHGKGRAKVTFKLDPDYRFNWGGKGIAYWGDVETGLLREMAASATVFQHPSLNDEKLMDGRIQLLARARVGMQGFDWKMIAVAVAGLFLLIILGRGFFS